MGEYSCYLVTVSYNGGILRVALKTKSVYEFVNEPENREKIWNELPPHVQNCGKVLHVEHLFDVIVNEKN